MRIALRAASRLVLVGGLSLSGLSLLAAPVRAASPSEKVLPANTVAFIKIENAAQLREAVNKSRIGQLIADPAMTPIKDDFKAKLEDTNKKVKEKLGVTLDQLFSLPQGQVYIAILPKDDPKVPISIVISADAGKNAATMQDVMSKATKEAEAEKAKVTTETYQGVKLTSIKSTKDEDKDNPPMVWANQGGVFYIASDAAPLKDVLSHASGRDDSLASNESFAATLKKVGGKDTQLTWFIDAAQIFKIVSQAGAAQGGNAQQIEAILQLTGLNTFKSIGGTVALNSGEYDRVVKTFVYSPGPAQGVLKVFSMPKVALKPQAWVPASAASYQSWSWDLDAAYAAISDLADMFAPGVLANIEKQIGGPEGKGLSFKDDLFGPLGDRITVVSDFKKPVTDKSQRVLFAIALEDPKAFQTTLNKIVDLTKANPKQREFQGTTIWDFDLPENVGAPGMPNLNLSGTLSVAVAKDHVFVTSEPSLLEQVLRSGGAGLADSPSYQAVAKSIPAQVSGMTYAKPDEQARILYDAIKGGQLDKALEGAKAAAGPNAPKVDQLIDPAKLPDFSVFAKYLTQGGSYSVMDDDGFTMTAFSLKKPAQP